MLVTRRAFVLLAAIALVAFAGGILRVACVGRACEETSTAANEAPFCRLPSDLRQRIADGFYDGRSPDVLGVTRDVSIMGGSAFVRGGAPRWPSIDAETASVPLVFWGTGVAPDASIPAGTTLDAVAPTVAEMIDLRRPHPEVRSGTPIPNVATGEVPRLLVIGVLRNVGTAELEGSASGLPRLESLIDEGAATMRADPGSEPLDPAAIETTIGTGGLPRQHGITGTIVRNSDTDRIVTAWSARAPVAVIAGLGDDLDEATDNSAEIGLVAPKRSDRGLIGGNWYVTATDDDHVSIGPRDPARAAVDILGAGFGEDEVPDLLGVVLEGGIGAIDEDLGAVIDAASRAAGGSIAVVVTATGAQRPKAGASYPASSLIPDLASRLGTPERIVGAVGVGGLFLNQAIVAEERIPERDVVSALLDIRSETGDRVFADAFPAIAVSLGRYC